jgi:hypothetical protein
LALYTFCLLSKGLKSPHKLLFFSNLKAWF